jgi:polyisoprenoid-binding protein YceI
MHGETHPVTLDVTVHGVTRDGQGQARVGFEARGTLSRSDFGLRWQQALETGGVVVGDEIRISADIAAGTERRDA